MNSFRVFALALFCVYSRIQVINGDSSVLFLDNPSGDYFRHSPVQTTTLTPFEVGAASSVLLGFPPPSILTASSSSKLNELLMPNPFNRPRAALMLEVIGVDDSEVMVESAKSAFTSALKFKVEGNERVDIHLPDEDKVSLFSLNEESSNVECSDKNLSDFASWLGGSYVEDASTPLNGELVIPMANGAYWRLLMSERADREYMTNLIFIINKIKMAIEMHNELTKSGQNPAELITGRFTGIKVLQDEYGSESISQNGLEVLFSSVSKIFATLQAAYQGKIVGVIVHGGSIASDSGTSLHVTVTSQRSARLLEEEEASTDDPKIAEVAFVRMTLAWITGIILLIATLLGIHFLMNMSLTKDTLLYSNVKLD